jgi:hypothetical protein
LIPPTHVLSPGKGRFIKSPLPLGERVRVRGYIEIFTAFVLVKNYSFK